MQESTDGPLVDPWALLLDHHPVVGETRTREDDATKGANVGFSPAMLALTPTIRPESHTSAFAAVSARMVPFCSRTCSSSQRIHGYITATNCVPDVNGPCGIEPLTIMRATP